METATNPDWDVAKLSCNRSRLRQSAQSWVHFSFPLIVGMASPRWWPLAISIVPNTEHLSPDRVIGRPGEPVDVITVADRLLATGELDAAGGHTYLAELAEQTPTASNVRAYAKAVRERSVLRQLINAAQDIASAGFNPEGRSSEELVDEAERLIMQISEGGQKAAVHRQWLRS